MIIDNDKIDFETVLDSPTILEIKIGFKHEFNQETETHYAKIQEELMLYIREKHKDILKGIESVYYEVGDKVDQENDDGENMVVH